MPHLPAWHIRDNDFDESNDGITTPTRNNFILAPRTSHAVATTPWVGNFWNVINLVPFPHYLRIHNLDRDDPPGYLNDSVPRDNAFNGNVLRISATPTMPAIAVECNVIGIDLAVTPIYWRVQCRHVLCRHQNRGNYRYRGACEIHHDEWHGRATTPNFTLFADAADPNVIYDFNSNPNTDDVPVMGGHTILSVAARPVAGALLEDHVHLRIGGSNPTAAEVLAWLDTAMATFDANVIHMVKAVFAHEANFRQFRDNTQTSTTMNFRQRHHQNNAAQPDCRVRFNWPDDPENYPLATFDWGIGISQYTKVQGRTIGARIPWDWRENLKIGVNLFLRNLTATYVAGQTWRAWAMEAWERYNGAGPQAEQYARTLRDSAEGQLVDVTVVPALATVHLDALATAADPAAPPAWPPAPPPPPGGAP